MFLLASVLVLLGIAFSFLDRLNFREEIIIGIACGVLLVLAYCLGAPWRRQKPVRTLMPLVMPFGGEPSVQLDHFSLTR